jgi:hypothetical protein
MRAKLPLVNIQDNIVKLSEGSQGPFRECDTQENLVDDRLAAGWMDN